MATSPDPDPSNDKPPRLTPFEPGPAANAVISLSQAILAPLDAIAKAQVHAARSFLNFVLQIGYPHVPVGADGMVRAPEGDPMYSQTFRLDHIAVNEQGQQERKSLTLSMPTLALVPLQPLGIESAHYDLELVVRELAHHRQIQRSEKDKVSKEPRHKAARGAEIDVESQPRPWYLVSEPVSVRGTLSDPGGEDSGSQKTASIKVHVELKSSSTPAGLAKLLSAMTQVSSLTESTPLQAQADPAEPS